MSGILCSQTQLVEQETGGWFERFGRKGLMQAKGHEPHDTMNVLPLSARVDPAKGLEIAKRHEVAGGDEGDESSQQTHEKVGHPWRDRQKAGTTTHAQ